MSIFFQKNRGIFLLSSRNVFFLSLILFFLEYFTKIVISNYMRMNLLGFILAFSGFSWLFFYIKKDEEYYKEKIEPFFKYGFLSLLFIITIGSLRFDFIDNILFLKNLINFISNYSYALVLLAIGSGFFTFYFNRERVEREIEDEKTKEEKAERKREKEFASKFPRINKIFGVRRLVKWMYKEGFIYILILILILALFTAVKAPYFGFSFTGEHSTKYMGHVDAARNMYENNNPFFRQQKYGVCPVERPTGIFSSFGGLPILDWGLLATFYAFPSNSLEFNTRLLMNFLGILALTLFYLFLSKWVDKKTSLLIVFLISINPIINFVFFVTVLDSWIIIFGLLSLFYLTKYIQNNYFLDLFLCGLFFGIGNITKNSLFLWLAPIILIFLAFNNENINKFLREYITIISLSLLPIVGFSSSLRYLPTNVYLSLTSFVVCIFIFMFIYYKLKKHEKLCENIIQKIISNRLKFIITSIFILFLGVLYFYLFIPLYRLDRFLTDFHILFNWNMYKYMLIEQFKVYMTPTMFYLGLIGFMFITFFGLKKYKLLLVSFFIGSLIYWVLGSKVIFFHSYYPHIIMITFALSAGLIFSTTLKSLRNKYLILISLTLFLLLIFPTSYTANIDRISKERPLEHIDEIILFMQQNMNETNIYLDERNHYRFLTIMTRIPQTSTIQLNHPEIIGKIKEIGFGEALNYYNLTYLITTRSEPEYEKYINLFIEESELLTKNLLHRRDLILNRVNSIPLPTIDTSISETLIEKYNITSKFELEKQIGRYKFYRFVN